MAIDKIDRRSFLAGGACAILSPRLSAGTNPPLCPTLTVFLADTHIAGHPERFPTRHQYGYLERMVAEILALPVRPARFVVFGDIARRDGDTSDYAMFLKGVKPLIDAGLEMTVTTGNHDNRAPMFEAFPSLRDRVKVPGRFVTVTDLGGGVDLVLLDTLNDDKQSDGTNKVGFALDAAQQDWMRRELPRWPRPYLLGGHHKLAELRFEDGGSVGMFAAACPNCLGYVHGHNHHVFAEFARQDYEHAHLLRTLGLASSHLEDIGWATCEVKSDRIVVTNHALDFVFPGVQPKEKREPWWDARIAEVDGAACTFARWGDRS